MNTFSLIMDAMPFLFYIWSGLLLSWGGYCLYRIVFIRDLLQSPDAVTVYAAIACQMMLSYVMFIDPSISYNMLEIVVSLAFWYSLILFYMHQRIPKIINQINQI